MSWLLLLFFFSFCSSEPVSLSFSKPVLLELTHAVHRPSSYQHSEASLLSEVEFLKHVLMTLWKEAEPQLVTFKEFQEDNRKKSMEKLDRKIVSKDDCGTFLDCESCFNSKVCAWCIGERVCVPDEVWMCQGEMDQVGSVVGKVRQCPRADETFEKRRLTMEEEQAKAEAKAQEKLANSQETKKIEMLSLTKSKLDCVGWRNTAGCTPDGTLEPQHHKSCDMPIVSGASGYCECEQGIRAIETTCAPHDSFTCREKCANFLQRMADSKAKSKQKLKQKVEDEYVRVRSELNSFTIQDLDMEFEVQASFNPGASSTVTRTENSQRKKDILERVKRIESGMTGTTHPYIVLGVEENASQSAIRKAYHKLSLMLHPDKNEGDLAEAAETAFADLIAAYEILSNPNTRSAFDDYGNRPGFSSQWEYEQSGQKDTRGFYAGFPYITTMTEKLWGKRVAGNTIWLVELYAAWCSACQNYVSAFKSIATSLNSPDKAKSVEIEVGAVNCEAEAHLCSQVLNVRAYPTLRLISKQHGVQQEYHDNDKSPEKVVAWAKEIAEEWSYLFEYSKIIPLNTTEEFNKHVIESDAFWMILILDGLECSSCKTAKTNMMRLSAAITNKSLNATCGFFDCSASSAHRTLCTSMGIPQSPFSPQVRGWSAGIKFPGDSGEALYNPNQIEPHFALELIERIMRLSTQRTVNTIATKDGVKFTANEKEKDTPKPPPPKPRWNGPSGRATLNAVQGGGNLPRQLGQ